MIQKITVSLSLLLFLFTAPAVAQMSIGYVNTQEVFNQMPERMEVQSQIDSLVQAKTQEYEALRNEFETKVNQFQQQQNARGAVSEQQMEQMNQELAEMEMTLQRYPQEVQQEVDQERSRLLAPLFTRISQAIQTVSEENGLDLVINRTTLMGDNILFYASDSATDVTPMVIAEVTGSQN